jgi:hypothetical protein
MIIYIMLPFEQKTEAVFLHPFTVCSLCKQKFVVCHFVDEETSGRYPFANGLNWLNGLARLCLYCTYMYSTYGLAGVEVCVGRQHRMFSPHKLLPPSAMYYIINGATVAIRMVFSYNTISYLKSQYSGSSALNGLCH